MTGIFSQVEEEDGEVRTSKDWSSVSTIAIEDLEHAVERGPPTASPSSFDCSMREGLGAKWSERGVLEKWN